MKKILTIFSVMLMMLFAFAVEVNAYTYNIEFNAQKTNLKPGDKVTIDVNLSNLNMDSNEAGIIGFEATLEYDPEVFSAVEVTGEDKWSGLLAYRSASKKITGFILEKENEVKEAGDIATITLTVGDNAKLGETTVKLKDIKTSNGSGSVTVSNVSANFLVVKVVDDGNTDNGNDPGAGDNSGNEDDNTGAGDNQGNGNNNTGDGNNQGNGNNNTGDGDNQGNGNDNTGDGNNQGNGNDNTGAENNKENNNENKNENKVDNTTNNKNNTTKDNTANTNKDNTIANRVISAAGLESVSAIIIGAIVVITGISYMSYKKYKNM